MPVQRRFRAAYAVLAVVVIAALAAVVLLVTHPASAGEEWSAFRPEGHGLAAAEQIAETVGANYRLPSGKQLVGVLAGTPQLQEAVPISAVAVTSGLPDQVADEIKVFRTTDTLVYVLCGIGGQQCAISEGKPSKQRALLLRREALELALHTFKYLGDTDAVLVLLPPPAGQQPSTAVYFRRDDYADELSLPLSASLEQRDRLKPGAMSPADELKVRRLTLADLVVERFSGIYSYQFTQSPDGTAIMALSAV